MSIYSSFLLRCWVKRGGAPPVFAAQHAQSGEEFHAPNLEEVFAWIRQRAHEEEGRENHDRRANDEE